MCQEIESTVKFQSTLACNGISKFEIESLNRGTKFSGKINEFNNFESSSSIPYPHTYTAIKRVCMFV